MFSAFGEIETKLGGAHRGMFYMGVIYSSGITEGWPKHCVPDTKAPTKLPSTTPSEVPTANEDIWDGKKKKVCKKVKNTCIFGNSKIFGEYEPKKSKYRYEPTQHDNEQTCSDDASHKGIFLFDDGVCSHVCDILEKKNLHKIYEPF